MLWVGFFDAAEFERVAVYFFNIPPDLLIVFARLLLDLTAPKDLLQVHTEVPAPTTALMQKGMIMIRNQAQAIISKTCLAQKRNLRNL